MSDREQSKDGFRSRLTSFELVSLVSQSEESQSRPSPVLRNGMASELRGVWRGAGHSGRVCELVKWLRQDYRFESSRGIISSDIHDSICRGRWTYSKDIGSCVDYWH